MTYSPANQIQIFATNNYQPYTRIILNTPCFWLHCPLPSSSGRLIHSIYYNTTGDPIQVRITTLNADTILLLPVYLDSFKIHDIIVAFEQYCINEKEHISEENKHLLDEFIKYLKSATIDQHTQMLTNV